MDQPQTNFSETSSATTVVQPLVAVVILNWNGRKYLEKFLPELIRSSYTNKRIIVADNASTDDSVKFVREYFPSVEIIINKSNEGFAKGYNAALARVTADYYVLLNSDVEVTQHWIEPVIELLENDASIGACQPKIRSYYNKREFEYAGACGGWIDALGYPLSRGRVFEFVEEDNGQYEDAAPCFWASGAALFIRANLYHQLKGLDEYFFAHQEEIDLCWRLQLEGHKVYVQPASVVYHIGGGTLPKDNSLKVYLNFRNNLIMLAKNLAFAEALWKIPFRMKLDAIAAWKGLLRGEGGYFKAICRAHFQFIKWLLFHRKKSLFPPKKQKELQGYYKGSAVWQYFVKGKRRFSEIVIDK